MRLSLSRRELLTSLAALPLATAIPLRSAYAVPARRLTIQRKTLEVNGQPASIFAILQDNGTQGLVLEPGQDFQIDLRNACGAPTIVHWHGQTPPAGRDGEADTGLETLISNDSSRLYGFAARPGTYWMHSHQGLQEQSLMAAPLIVRRPEEVAVDAQEVVVLLQDFSFRNPQDILASLTDGKSMPMEMSKDMPKGMAMDMPMDMNMPDHAHMHHMPGNDMRVGTPQMSQMSMDLNDVDYDAYLANERTLADPEIVRVEKGGRVRLRLINGASSTAFWIDLGALQAEIVAVDGNPVAPLSVRRFPMAQAQRVDVMIRLPQSGGAFPILAQREGDRPQTGIVLATTGASIAKIALNAATQSKPVNLSLERRLTAAQPLAPRAPDRTYRIHLTGGMMPYAWGIDGRTWADHQPLVVKQGERIVVDLVNEMGMAHPMHLHGHHFQVLAIDGAAFAGALRDTVLVPPNGSVRIGFDADNPGRWLFHCHNLYHMAVGMMTEVAYAGFPAGHQ